MSWRFSVSDGFLAYPDGLVLAGVGWATPLGQPVLGAIGVEGEVAVVADILTRNRRRTVAVVARRWEGLRDVDGGGVTATAGLTEFQNFVLFT